MLEITKEIPNHLSYPIDEHAIFLSIDTTGFQAEVSAITAIGMAQRSGTSIRIRQWFNDTGFDQKKMLLSFFKEISTCQSVITYYGNRFLLPFIDQKAAEYDYPNPLSSMESKDYYDIIYPLRKILELPSCRQATLEASIDYQRTSKLSGKKLVNTYQKYQKHPDQTVADDLILHNQESIEALLQFAPVFSYDDLIKGKISNCNILSIGDTKATFTFQLPYEVLKPIHYTSTESQLHLNGKKGILIFQIDDQGQIKHYFPNSRDYYYLPMEDRAIHKSLASYVPKEYKEKATACTCYDKLSIHSPALKKEASLHQLIHDTILYLIRDSGGKIK